MALEVHRFGETTVYVDKAPKGQISEDPRDFIYFFIGRALSKEALHFLKTQVPCRSQPYFVILSKNSRQMKEVCETLLSSATCVISVLPLYLVTIIWGQKLSHRETMARKARQIAKTSGSLLEILINGSCMAPAIKRDEIVSIKLGQKPDTGDIGLIQGEQLITHRIQAIFSLFGWCLFLHSGENSRLECAVEMNVLGTYVLNLI